jgi:hypothetical protein
MHIRVLLLASIEESDAIFKGESGGTSGDERVAKRQIYGRSI